MSKILRVPPAALWTVVSAYAAALVVGSVLPVSSISAVGISGFDKVLHFVAYLVLAFLLTIALRSRPATWRGVAVTAGVAATVYGGLIEALQAATSRLPEAADLVADAVGATVGAVSAWWIFRPVIRREGDA